MQVCTSLQTDKHASTPPLTFLQAGCSSCRPTNSVKALKAQFVYTNRLDISFKWFLLSLNTVYLLIEAGSLVEVGVAGHVYI